MYCDEIVISDAIILTVRSVNLEMTLLNFYLWDVELKYTKESTSRGDPSAHTMSSESLLVSPSMAS